MSHTIPAEVIILPIFAGMFLALSLIGWGEKFTGQNVLTRYAYIIGLRLIPSACFIILFCAWIVIMIHIFK